MDQTVPTRLAAYATALATALVIIAVSSVPFLTPAWVSFEQGRSQAAAWTGFSPAELSGATESILHDLVVGPPDFAVTVDGAPVLSERERSHMRDVRGVFAAFALISAVAAVGLVLLVACARRMGHPERAWAGIAAGARWLIVGVVVAGVVAALAFDRVFEVFHRLFFPGGSYDFDPRTDRLVQLFPFDFWFETTLVIGVVIVGLALAVWMAGRRLANRPAAPSRVPEAMTSATAEAIR